MALKYTFRMAEIPQVGFMDTADKQAALEGAIRDMTRQGWEIAEWKLTTVGDTCGHVVYAAILFSRRDPPLCDARYIDADCLEASVQDWRDKQAEELKALGDSDYDASVRLAGAIEAFEQVLNNIREASEL
jgi:hypothetical protein